MGDICYIFHDIKRISHNCAMCENYFKQRCVTFIE